MDDAINELQIALYNAENNGPIYASEGDTKMAERCAERAISLRAAIEKLKG